MHDSTVSSRSPSGSTSAAVPDTRSGSVRPWLLLLHQFPPEPAYLRVKVRRRLRKLGAVPLQNAVYALPVGDEEREDFEWLRQEIERAGGEAAIGEVIFVDGVTEEKLTGQFRALREADYDQIVLAAQELLASLEVAGPDDGVDDEDPARLRSEAGELRRRLTEVRTQDRFGSPGGDAAERTLASLEEALRARPADRSRPGGDWPEGRTWVTRRGVKVDRMASAWLIRRFIDPAARFKFVSPDGYEPAAGELRFDMYEGEYTHVGRACSFETLLSSFALGDEALVAIGEIVHDIDCKDDRFGRPETPGVAALISGIVAGHRDDEARLDRGAAVFDDLYEHLRTTPA